ARAAGARAARPARAVALGLAGPAAPGDLARVRAAARDGAAVVRAAALGALVRAASPRDARRAWGRAVVDADPGVRRRAADLAPGLAARRRRPDPELETALRGLLGDPDVTVVEAAAWALGEAGDLAGDAVVAALAGTASDHDDPLAREAAVAALGAIGSRAGLPAILAACRDKPAIRRRAVLALAPFDGPDVDAALRAALDDHDWQVRQ